MVPRRRDPPPASRADLEHRLAAVPHHVGHGPRSQLAVVAQRVDPERRPAAGPVLVEQLVDRRPPAGGRVEHDRVADDALVEPVPAELENEVEDLLGLVLGHALAHRAAEEVGLELGNDLGVLLADCFD